MVFEIIHRPIGAEVSWLKTTLVFLLVLMAMGLLWLLLAVEIKDDNFAIKGC